ncbi:hypothetical protein DITRI_Ditri20bG0046400 [Diplodiscus trichospermus]
MYKIVPRLWLGYKARDGDKCTRLLESSGVSLVHLGVARSVCTPNRTDPRPICRARLAGCDRGMNTDFQKVFDLILKVAVEGQLKPEQMIKRLFVFSDMEFDQASTSPWETDHQVIVRKFTEKGYGEAIPQIVFWNLRDSRATPVPGAQNGVALVSGFSKNLIKMFLDKDGDINPQAVMEAAISGEEYQKLVVLD